MLSTWQCRWAWESSGGNPILQQWGQRGKRRARTACTTVLWGLAHEVVAAGRLGQWQGLWACIAFVMGLVEGRGWCCMRGGEAAVGSQEPALHVTHAVCNWGPVPVTGVACGP